MFPFAGCSLGRTLEQKSDATYVNCIWACFVGFGLVWFFSGSFLYGNMNTYRKMQAEFWDGCLFLRTVTAKFNCAEDRGDVHLTRSAVRKNAWSKFVGVSAQDVEQQNPGF